MMTDGTATSPESDAPLTAVTVLIATRNRPDALDLCLEHLAKARPVAGWRFSVVVVENGEDGQTPQVVKKWAGQASLPIVYVQELRPGLSMARNRGLAEADVTSHIAIIDDDIVVPEDYFENLVAALAKYPKAGVIGGWVDLYDQRDLPMTILRRNRIVRFGPDIQAFGFLHGCNLLVRREAALEFDTRLGAGAKTRAAEDCDYYYRIWRNGFDVMYDPMVFVAHNHGRRDPADIQKLLDGYFMGQGAFYIKHLLKGDGDVARRLYWHIRLQIADPERREYGWREWRQRLKGALAFCTSRK